MTTCPFLTPRRETLLGALTFVGVVLMFGACGDQSAEKITLDDLIRERRKTEPLKAKEFLQATYENPKISAPNAADLDGFYRGTILYIPDEENWNPQKREALYTYIFSGQFLWKGKIFDRKSRTGYNKLDLSVFDSLLEGLGESKPPAARDPTSAAMDLLNSWIKALGSDKPFLFDFYDTGAYENPSDIPIVLLDYSRDPDNPFPTRLIRDELRRVNSHLYLGKAYIDVFGYRTLLLYFALDKVNPGAQGSFSSTFSWNLDHTALSLYRQEGDHEFRVNWPQDLKKQDIPPNTPVWTDHSWEQYQTTTRTPILMEADVIVDGPKQAALFTEIIEVENWKRCFNEKILQSDIQPTSQSLYSTLLNENDIWKKLTLLGGNSIAYEILMDAGWGSDDIRIDSQISAGYRQQPDGDIIFIADNAYQANHTLQTRDFYVAIVQDKSLSNTYIKVVYSSVMNPKVIGNGEAIKRNKAFFQYFVTRLTEITR